MAMLAAMTASLSLVVLTACGDDDEPAADAPPPAATVQETTPSATGPGAGGTAPPGGTTVEIPAAEQGLAYAKTTASAPAGDVTLSMPNPSTVPHNIAVDEPEQQLGEIVEQGGVSEITATFTSGEYEYYCSVPGHRQAGMVGTLTVE